MDVLTQAPPEPQAPEVPWSTFGWTLGWAVGAGLAAGGAWRMLAPLAVGQISQGQFITQAGSEFSVAQDGYFAVIFGVVGILAAVWQGMRPRDPEALRSLLLLSGVVVSGVIAWQFGRVLGPDSLVDQVSAGLTQVQSPLNLHSPSALLAGPILFCITRALTAFFTSD